MLYRQSKDTFIREIGPYGYVTNQRSKRDRVFDNSGQVFLRQVKRSCRTVDDSVAALTDIFTDVTDDMVRPDFLDFLIYLEKYGFVVSGETEGEIEAKDLAFSYKAENPKTFTFDFRQSDDTLEVEESQVFLDSYLREHPVIWHFQMEVTSRCNERCVHCYIPHENKLHDIDLDLALSTIDQVAQAGAIGITFSGGEASIYQPLPHLIHHARSRDLSVHILSNLMDISDELYETMVNARLNLVQVSVYSLRPEEHDAITMVPGSLKKTLRNVEKLLSADVPLQISCPVMNINYKSYKEVLRWAADRKIKAYTDFIMMARTDGSTSNLDLRINRAQAKEMLEDIIEVDEDYRIMVAEEPEQKLFMDQKDKPVCGVGINTLCMVASGDCYPCAGWQGYSVGSLRTASLMDIWEKSPQLLYLRNIKRGDFPQCQACQDQNYCAMCMVRNFNETGDLYKTPRHFCDMAALNREVVEAHRNSKV